MITHPYVRAYMAGVTVPSVFMLLALSAYLSVRAGYTIDYPVEKMMVFPMAIVPALWGLWNMAYLALDGRRRWPIGIHGAVVPLAIFPVALAVAKAAGLGEITTEMWIALPLIAVVYYLVWKYVVGGLNRLVGIGGE
jgi:hypothetical protein